jgi:hypothetical protein
MAPPKQTDTLARYERELKRSAKWRDDDRKDDLWRRMIDLYSGKHFGALSQDDRLIINIAFATKNVIAPSVAVNNPKFTVNARKPEHAPHAIITEEVLNYLWRAHKYKKPFRLAVDDFLIVGHGWLKVGYKFVSEPKEKKAEGDDGGEVEPGIDDREPVPGNVESEQNVIDDRPFVERVSVFDMYVDPDARSIEEMRWIAQRVRRPLADVRVDSRYEASVRRKVNKTTSDKLDGDERSDSSGSDNEGNTSDSGYVDIIEYYDLKRKVVCTFARGCDEGFLIKPQPMPYSFGHPFVMMRNYEVPDTFYPMGELEAIESLQLELNGTRTQMFNHRKRFARKWLYDQDMFDDEGIKALKSDVDNTLVPVSTDGGNLDKSIQPMPSVGTPPDMYNQSDLISADIDRVSGVSDYMRGAMPNIRRTATEAAMLQDAQNSRAQDKLAGIEEVLSEVGQRLVSLMQQYLSSEQAVRIVGSTAMPIWVNYDRDYIQGDFDYEVEGGSTQPRNESFRRQSALQLVDAMAPFIGQGTVDPAAVVRHVLQYGFGVKNVDNFLAMAPMPGQVPGQPPMPGQQVPGEPPTMTQPTGVGAPEEQQQIPGIPNELIAQLDGFNPSSGAMAA